jgi:hypothetical protein
LVTKIILAINILFNWGVLDWRVEHFKMGFETSYTTSVWESKGEEQCNHNVNMVCEEGR